MPQIRAARESDAREIARLCVELGYPVTPDAIRSRIASLRKSDNRIVLVACGSKARLLGWVAAARRLSLASGERVEIEGLVVDGSAQRRGIGQGLVARVEKWTSANGLSTVVVRSNVTRQASHEFYPAIGYERRKTQHGYARRL